MLPRIAILTNYPADHLSFGGGVESATAALLEGLREFQSEYEFHVVALSGRLARDDTHERDGFHYHFLRTPRQWWIRPRLPLRILRVIHELRRIQPALVHCQDNMAMGVAAIAFGCPRIFTIHGVKRHEAWKRTGWEFWSALADAALEQYVYRHFHAFICNSSYAARVLGAGKSLYTIPNAVSGRYRRASSTVSATHHRLVFIGALAPLKRPLDLLHAHARLRAQYPNLETLFCGAIEDHRYVNQMHRLIHAAGIQGARFVGTLGQEKLAELLAGATALVLPSAQENAPMVIAEAMSAGVPVVATRVGGIPDMVADGESGLLYESGDVRALTDCIRRLLDDPGWREELGRHAERHAQRTYLPTHIARATVEAYGEVIRRSSRGDKRS